MLLSLLSLLLLHILLPICVSQLFLWLIEDRIWETVDAQSPNGDAKMSKTETNKQTNKSKSNKNLWLHSTLGDIFGKQQMQPATPPVEYYKNDVLIYGPFGILTGRCYGQ